MLNASAYNSECNKRFGLIDLLFIIQNNGTILNLILEYKT